MTEILKKSFEDRLQKAVQLISSANFQYLKIGIFGSYARGTATGSSDIDIAIIVNERPDRHISGPLREECEILGVDVVFMTMGYFRMMIHYLLPKSEKIGEKLMKNNYYDIAINDLRYLEIGIH